MPHPVKQQLSAIHAMLSAGHRNLRIERHSLLLWGLAGGLLLLLSESILTPEQLPVLEQRALAWLLLLVFVLGGVGLLDWQLTRRAKQARDEAWSFIHRQVQKVWWLLMATGTLLTFAMFFFGGGYMVCAAWLVLIGMGLYIHGLFSEELLEWIGALTIVIGIACLATRQSYETMRWIATAVFALGMPLLALMLDRGRHRSAGYRLGQMLLWLLPVLALPLAAQLQAQSRTLPDGPVISLAAYRQGQAQRGEHIVELPAGTAIPVEVELGGDLFAGQGNNISVLPLTLSEPVQVLLRDGKLTGDSRLPGEPWHAAREARWISIPWSKAELTPERGPVVRTNLIVRLRPRSE
jgi:hypothetical protein